MMDVDNNNWTPRARDSWEGALDIANSKEHTILNITHLFCSLWNHTNPSFISFLSERGVKLSPKRVSLLIDKFAEENKDLFYGEGDEVALAFSMHKCVESSVKLVKKHENRFVGVEHFIYGIVDTCEGLSKFLLSQKIDPDHLKLAISVFVSGDFDDEDGELEAFGIDDDDDDDDSFTKSSKSAISKYCVLLNDIVASPTFPKISGRDSEIRLMEEILCRKTKSNCILVGEAGTGKTAIVEGLAQLISSEDYHGPLKGKKIYTLDTAGLVAGTKYRGQFEERLSAVLKEFKADKESIMFIDEIHTIIGTGGREGSQDFANIIKPALSRGEIKTIGATTTTEYKKYFEKDAALARRFHPVPVNDPSMETLLEMVKTSLPSYELHHGVKYSKELAEKTVKLCETYLPHQRFPDKAFDVIDHACSKARIRNKEEGANVEDDDVYSVIADKVSIDIETIKESSSKTFAGFIPNIKDKVYGQDKHIESIYDVLACAKTGLSPKGRPIASFLFVGPTSVGKTYTARHIAEEFYGNDQSFLRLDMSEYQETSSISRLIGASAGYVGYEDGGILTEFVRKNPNSLILFDESEQCSPTILNLLLQILDYGKLKDNLNRDVDFSRCIIVLTSNVGAREAKKPSMGFNPHPDSKEDSYNGSVTKLLLPQLVSRIDEIIVFNDLCADSINMIFNSRLQDLKEALLNNGISADFEITYDEFLLNQKTSEHARDLKKSVRKKIEVPLAKFIVKNPEKKKILIKMIDGDLNLS